MKKVKLFINPILYYMEDSSGFASSYYIDLFKEKVVSPEVDDDVSFEDVANKERYFYIKPITSHEGYEIMQDFAALEESDEIQAHLFDVLQQKKPFLNFKNAIADYADIQKKYYEYKDNRLKEILRNQLAECGYELEEKTLSQAEKD